MWKKARLGVVCGHVPWGTCCGIKVIVPVLVKGVVGVGYVVDQAVVQDLGWSCTVNDKSEGALYGCNGEQCLLFRRSSLTTVLFRRSSLTTVLQEALRT